MEEKRLALQRVFHITGEYLKDTETTPNLLSDVRQSLEETGIPTKLLSKFRDALAHYHVFPFIEADDEKIQQLFDEGFLSIQRIVEDRIIEREESLIQRIIEENESKIKDKSVVEQLKESISNEGVRGLEKYIRTIKSQPKYRSMDNESKKLVDEIYQNALRMKSVSKDFSQDQREFFQDDLDKRKSQISNSIEQYIEQIQSEKNKVEVYERLYNKLDLDNLDNAHDDVLKITKVIDRLRGEDTSNSILDNFLNTELLGKIKWKINNQDFSLKEGLERYFDAESFKNNDVHYVDFKDSNPQNLINLLDKNISGTNDNKSKLIDFFKSISVSQDNESNYIPPDEYEKLVSGLKINVNDKEKLLFYSVEWRKKKCIDLLKKNPPALKKIYDSIMEGEAVKEPVYESLASQYPHETSGSLNQMISEKIEKFYLSRIYKEFDVLGKVKNPYAVEAQIVNIYALLEKAKGSQEEIFKVKKLRNYLSHGDALTSDKDDKDIAEDLVKLKDDIVQDLVKLKDKPPSEVKGFKITLQKIESAIDDLQSHVSLEGKKRIVQLLCPIGSAPKISLHLQGARRRRFVSESCLTWEEIDKFNEGGPENRDPDNIIIDSEKFLSSISNELEANEEKFSNFIALASESEVIGDHKNKVNMLTDNHRYLGHLERVGKVSGMVMHGMIAKNVVGDLLRGDYEGVAINLGFLAGGQGLAKVAEVASMKGASYILGGRALLGKSLRFASPFLARGVSAFIAYDLYNQVKEYEKGNKDALVPIIGDSLQLGVDSVELGIEIGEGLGLELLEGVSAVTGPIGMGIAVVVFVGTDVYMAVRTVEKIDEQIHLTGWEKATEGMRAFFGQQPSEDIEKLIEEKGANNQAVKNTMGLFEGNSHIQRYVFPSIKVTGHGSGGKHTYQIILDNVVSLDQKRSDIKWSRTRPDNLEGIDLFCLPKGNWEAVPKEGTYYCDGAIGAEYTNNRTGNYTLISLGDGKDKVKGFQDSSNIFVLGDGHKEMVGGMKDDNFIFQEESVNATYDSEIRGSINGLGGIDTIDVGGLIPRYKESKGVGKYQVFADFRKGVLKDTSKVALNISNVNQFLGRKGRVDQVVYACDTIHVDGKGGENKDYLDSITIPKNDACFYNTKIIVNPYTKVTNSAINGNFTYFVRGEKGKEAYIDLGPNSQSNNAFVFEYTLKDIAAIDKSEKNITFSFIDEFYKREKKVDVNSSFTLTVSGTYKNITKYQLIDSTQIVMGQNNLYAMQNTEKPIDSLVRDYSSIADKSKMYVVVRSNDEVLTIGHSHHDILMNDPKARASHLVGNGGENVFAVTSGYEKLTLEKLPISDVIIYDFDQENKIDTLDLREIKEQLKRDIGREVNTEVSKVDSDFLINLFLDDTSKKEVVKVRLKGALENNWYKRVNIVIDSVFVIEEILGDFELTLRPLIFDDHGKTIYVINPRDIVEGDKIRVKKEIGDYIFARDNDALVITNSLSSNVDKDNLSTIILNDFYYENNQDKMQSLKIEFNDKKILLRKETERINSAGNFSELKRKVKVDSYKAVMYEIKKQKLFEVIERNNIGEVKRLIDNGVSIDARNNDGQTLLHSAAKSGKLEIVEYLIEKKHVDFNVKDNSDQTPLHYAADHGKLGVVKYLVEKGADVNVKDKSGQTPLHSAAKSGSLEVVKYLIEEKGVDFNIKNGAGQTPLHLATIGLNLDLVDYLLERKSADVNVKDNSGQTPLHLAVSDSELRVVRYLVEKKNANINVTDNYGQTPLHSAAKSGNLEVVKYLIEKKGADVNVRGGFERSYLNSAAEGGSLEVVKYLIEEKGANVNVKTNLGAMPLHLAARGGNLEVVRYLIEKKDADVNITDNSGQTPLHYAAGGGNLEVIKYLIEEKGANVNVKTNFGITPLHLAAVKGNLEVVKYLIEEKGANVNVKTNFGVMPLHYAVNNVTLELLKYLVEEKNFDVNVKDNSGITPLHYAADYGKLEMVKYLVKKGAKIDLEVNGEAPLEMLERRGHEDFASSIVKELTERLFDAVKYDDFGEVQGLINQGVSVNVKSSDGQRLLHLAALDGKLKVVKYLIEEKDANFKLGDNDGKTPLHYAAEGGSLEVVKYLIEKGADVNVKDNYGKTPLHSAAKSGKLEVVKYIVEKRPDSVNVKDNYGCTPLHFAVFSSLEIVKYLVEKKPDSVNVKDNYGKTPLHYAARGGKLEIIKYIVEKKPDSVNVKDNDGKTSLHYAVLIRSLEMVKYLVEKKPDSVDVKNDTEQTPLHYAVLIGSLEMVEYLVEKRPDSVNVKDNDGKTPLHFAAGGGKLEIVKYLVEKRPDSVNVKDNYGKTPLCLAENRGHSDVARYLERKLNEKTEKPQQRKRRHHHGDRHHSLHRLLTTDSSNQQEIATSNANQKSSWINDFVGWVKNSIGKLSSKPEEASNTASSIPQVDEQFVKASVSSSSSTSTTLPSDGTDKKQENGGFFRDNIDYVNANIKQIRERQTPVKFKPSGGNTILEMGDHYLSHVDFNGTIMLLDLLIRKVTGQKYISTVDQSISPLEAQGYALNITKEFEKALNETAIKSGISVTNLNFDPVAVQSAIVGQIINGRFSETSKTLYSSAKEACPEFKQTDKFLAHLRSSLEGEKEAVLLQQKVEKPSKILDQQVSRKVELSKKPNTFLNGTSVVKGISSVLER